MEKISSLHSPHIGRVKALLGSRGKKNRDLENSFIAEGIQVVREALRPNIMEGFKVKQLFLTADGISKLSTEIDLANLRNVEVFDVNDQVMKAMSDSETPQGILALCSSRSLKIEDLWEMNPTKIAFFWQIQDPGNAGTVIRTADACGFDAVVLSSESVDIFNPKTVRATVGSLWHIPVIADVKIEEFIEQARNNALELYALTGKGSQQFNADFISKIKNRPSAWIFGNEARGLPDLISDLNTVAIPMKGLAESLNVASAAAIVLHSVGFSL